MAEYLIKDTTLSNIADAIRDKTGKTDEILVSNMATEIAEISTGAELNFEVVGGTVQPENSKENTIWINTYTEITSWDFYATEPYRRSGTKNLNNYPYYHTTRTTNGITFTDNGDGTVTVNGTATADAYFRCQNTGASPSYNTIPLTPGTYTLWDSGNNSDCRAEIGISYDNGSTWSFYNCNNGAITIEVLYRALARINLLAKSGKTINNLVLKPQLEKGSVATSFVKGDATGQVWIVTETSSSAVNFNALNENGIEIHPMSAKQYINGSWVSMDAHIYQNNEWLQFKLYLYKEGDECTNITGGWDGNKSSNYLSFGGSDSFVLTNTKNKISCEGYTKLIFEYKFTTGHGSGNGNMNFALSDRKEVAYRQNYAIASVRTSSITQGNTYTIELDVSSVTQDAYVTLSGWYGSGDLYNAWLER